MSCIPSMVAPLAVAQVLAGGARPAPAQTEVEVVGSWYW